MDDVDGYRNLQELLKKLDAALIGAPQTKAAAAAAQESSAKASSSCGPQGSLAEPLVRNLTHLLPLHHAPDMYTV